MAAALGRSVWGNWSNGHPLARQLIDMGPPVFVAKTQQGHLVGYCTGITEADNKTGYVLSITLHSDYRQKGLGSRLVGAVINVLREQGRHSINTVISDDNAASKKLFMKFGFREFKKMKNYYEAGDTYCLFKLVLL